MIIILIIASLAHHRVMPVSPYIVRPSSMISFSQYSYILFTGLGYHHHFGAIHIILLGHDKVNKYVTDKENNRDNNQDNNKDSTKGDLVFTLALVAAITPHAPIDMSCLPPFIPIVPTCHGETGLTGEILGKPRKVVLMILFSFEVDTLEIALWEQ